MTPATLLRTGTPGTTSAARGFDAKWLVIAACVAIAVYLGAVPLGFLLWQSFLTPQSAAHAAELTLGNYRTAYGSAVTWILFWNSLRFAAGASMISR